VADRAAQRKGGGSNGNSSDSRGLKPFQFGFAVGECIVLKRNQIDLCATN
jgi:hypothetical protein